MTHFNMTHLNKKNTRIVIGNPGCGKTTQLITELRNLVEAGVSLKQIAVCSFSVAAIDEVITRALASLPALDKQWKKELLYFKTLHAMAFHLLGLSAGNLLTDDQLFKFARMVDIPISGQNAKAVHLKGDKILHIINTARLYNIPIRDYMIKEDIHTFPVNVIEDIANRYRDFKIIESVYDYTDMLVMARDGDLDIPKLHTIFIDEAQDLSTLQWILVNRIAEFAEHVVVFGDDKQSINTFAGADVETFLNLPGKVEVLQQSYRVPKAVFATANRLTQHMLAYRKEGTDWKPRADLGTCKQVSNLPYHKLVSGDWLILTRTNFQLEAIRDDLLKLTEDGALLFTVNGEAPVDMDYFRAIDFLATAKLSGKSLEELLSFNTLDSKETRAQKIDYINLLKKCVVCDDTLLQPWEMTSDFLELLERPWQEAFTSKLPPFVVRYISRMYPRYKQKKEDLFADAPIRLMTIHAAKGREATNVIVATDVTRAVREEILRKDTDVECKIFYVAVTRAKQNLYIYTRHPRSVGLTKYL